MRGGGGIGKERGMGMRSKLEDEGEQCQIYVTSIERLVVAPTVGA